MNISRIFPYFLYCTIAFLTVFCGSESQEIHRGSARPDTATTSKSMNLAPTKVSKFSQAASSSNLASIIPEIPDSAKVEKVIDGITIEILIEGEPYRIRYIGLDLLNENPEVLARAKELNRFLVEGKVVSFREDSLFVKNFEDTYFYRYVYASGESINIRMLTSGLTEISSNQASFDERGIFVDAWDKSQASKEGANLEKRKLGCGTLPCPP